MAETHEIVVLNAISQLLLQEHKGVQPFLKQVFLKANELIGSDIGFIGLIEEVNGEKWVVLRDKAQNIIGTESEKWTKYIGRQKVGGIELPKHERSFIGYVAYTKEARRSGDVRKEKFYHASNEKTQSELAVPILLDGEVLGVINLESKTKKFYTSAHEKILQIVARLIARTLDSLMTREGFRRPFIKILDQIRDELDGLPPGISINASAALNNVAEIVAKALHSKSCTIWLLNEAETKLILRGAYGPHRRYVTKHQEQRGDTLPWRAMAQRCLMKFGPNFPRDKLSGKYDATVYGEKLKTPFIIAPLLARGKPIGVLKVGLKKRARDNPQGYYTETDEQILNMVQGQIAAALELNRLEIERRERTQERLGPLSSLLAIFTELELKTVLNKAVRVLPKLCGGRGCSIFLWDEQRQAFVLEASKGLPLKMIGKAAYQRGEGLTGWVGLHGKSLILDRRAPTDLKKVHPDLTWKGKYNEVPSLKDLDLYPFIAVPIFRDGRSIGVIRISDRKKGYFTECDEQVMTLVATHISMAIVYCDRYEDRVKLLKEMQKLMVLTKTLSRLDVGIDDFERAILEEVAKSASEVLKTDVLTLYRVDQRDFDTPPIAKGKVRHPQFMNTRIYPDDVPSYILQHGSQYWPWAQREPILIGDVPPRDGLPARPRFVVREGIASSAGIRLEVGGRVVGVMFLNFKTHQEFEPEKHEIIETFASQTALSLEIARLYRQIRESASRKEADYLAQELHDAVLQTLVWEVVNRVGSAKDLLRSMAYQGAEEHLTVVEKAAKYCADECQFIMGLLKTHIVDELGLEEALKRFIDEVVKPSGLQIDFHVKKCLDKRFPVSIERHLYRIAQAALGNILAHAEARSARIRLENSFNNVRLSIEDDGIGFDPNMEFQAEGKYGLKGIRERAEALKGQLAIDSQPGKGTRITVVIPNQGGTGHEKAISSTYSS